MLLKAGVRDVNLIGLGSLFYHVLYPQTDTLDSRDPSVTSVRYLRVDADWGPLTNQDLKRRKNIQLRVCIQNSVKISYKCSGTQQTKHTEQNEANIH